MVTPTPLAFTYTSLTRRDSTTLPLKLDVHLPPASTSSTALPIVFAFHPGGFISYGRDHIPPWILDLGREKGWIIVSPDYRLLIGSLDGVTAGEQTTNSEFDAGDCVQDVLDAHEWCVGGELDRALKEQGLSVAVDTKKVAAVGWSIGGYLTHLLPSLIPTHLPPLTSIVSLYAVTRPLHPFYHTPRTPSTRPSPPNSINPSEPVLTSLNFTPTFDNVSTRLFTNLLSSGTITGEADYTPSEKRALEKEGAGGYRGMLWDWCIEKGLVRDLWLGLPLPAFPAQKGKNTSSPARVDFLKERLQALVGPNSPQATTHPDAFLIHGDADTLVPWEESFWALGRLCGAGVRTKYVSVVGVDHGWDGGMGVEEREDGVGGGLFRSVGEWVEGSWGRRR